LGEVPTLDIDDAIHHLEKNYNFHPGKKYKLRRIQGHPSKPELWNTEAYRPARHIQLPEDPVIGWSIKELRNKKDFQRYFEDEFGNLPNGQYTAFTGLGRGKGFAWFFRLKLEDGQVTNWWDKSQAQNRHYSSSYYAFQKYFNLREDWNV